jgi:hypothetical protein
MLARVKPLAHFSDCYPPEPSEEIIPGDAFAPYVQSGQFVERLFVSLEEHDTSVPAIRGIRMRTIACQLLSRNRLIVRSSNR